jgi:hypothetical protein
MGRIVQGFAKRVKPEWHGFPEPLACERPRATKPKGMHVGSGIPVRRSATGDARPEMETLPPLGRRSGVQYA